jgi:TatD DNase family protein
MLIDSHAHVNFNAFKEDYKKVIQDCLDKDIWMINVGTQKKTSERAVNIAQEYPEGIYAAVGLHPIHLDTGLVKMKVDTEEINFNSKEEEFDYDFYKNLSKRDKVVAIGEIGLDYYWRPKTKARKELFKQKQKDLLKKQIELAKDVNLPAILHCRVAHNDMMEVLSEIRPERAVAHSFVGDVEQLSKYLEYGYYIGLNGIIFKKIEGINFEETIKEIPLERLLVETDCPYLAPPPFLNQRNTPLYLTYIIEEVARIKNASFDEVAEATAKNTKDLFEI